jgi:SAM-dependent methyltransferase
MISMPRNARWGVRESTSSAFARSRLAEQSSRFELGLLVQDRAVMSDKFWPARWKLNPESYAAYSRDAAKPMFSRQLCLALLARHVKLEGATGFDFGCGDALFIKLLRSSGARVKGCDATADVLPPNDPDLWVGTATSLSRLPSASLDFFTERNVALLLDDDERALLYREAHRTLKPNGLFLTPDTRRKQLRYAGVEATQQPTHVSEGPRGLRFRGSRARVL